MDGGALKSNADSPAANAILIALLIVTVMMVLVLAALGLVVLRHMWYIPKYMPPPVHPSPSVTESSVGEADITDTNDTFDEPYYYPHLVDIHSHKHHHHGSHDSLGTDAFDAPTAPPPSAFTSASHSNSDVNDLSATQSTASYPVFTTMIIDNTRAPNDATTAVEVKHVASQVKEPRVDVEIATSADSITSTLGDAEHLANLDHDELTNIGRLGVASHRRLDVQHAVSADSITAVLGDPEPEAIESQDSLQKDALGTIEQEIPHHPWDQREDHLMRRHTWTVDEVPSISPTLINVWDRLEAEDISKVMPEMTSEVKIIIERTIDKNNLIDDDSSVLASELSFGGAEESWESLNELASGQDLHESNKKS